MKNLLPILAVLMTSALTLGATSVSVAQDEPLSIQQAPNGIAYVSGGVGDQEQRMVKELGAEFGLEVLLALEEGNYLADVPVRIVDEQGATVLEVTASGPYLLVDLDPGSYTVEATHEGVIQEKTARVDSSGQEQLNFLW